MPVSRLRGCLCGSVYPIAMGISFDPTPSQWEVAYRTCRACKSTGAPDKIEAGSISPDSLPSMTRFGIGEKFLKRTVRIALYGKHYFCSRSCMVDGSMVVWLMVYNSFTRTLLPYHSRITWCRSRRSRGIGFWCWLHGSVLVLAAGCFACPSDMRRRNTLGCYESGLEETTSIVWPQQRHVAWRRCLSWTTQ